MEIYSNSLPEFADVVENPALRDSLMLLKSLLGRGFSLRQWDENRIAVRVELNVDLPTLGTYKGIDIRPIEPIILVFSLTDYPFKCPIVLTDRTDFPKDKLAHLYIAKNNRPPAFCFIRGKSDEWYANKRVTDLLIRISNWLRDAAAGELAEDGEQFEPLRLEAYSGTIIYDYDTVAEVVHNKKSFLPEGNFAVALFERGRDEDALTYKMVDFLNDQTIAKLSEEFDKERKKDKDAPGRKHYYYGYILWNPTDHLFPDYSISFPTDWEAFKIFCQEHNIDLVGFENCVATMDENIFIHFPVIVAIKRPSNLIGYSSNIELVNFRFRIDSGDIADGNIIANFPIKYQAHNQPLTRKLARRISGDNEMFPPLSVIFGCGALGSKIAMHFARSGHTDFTLIDPDHLSPHNLVRHSLGAEDEGANKAYALKEAIKKMYPYDKLSIFGATSFKDGFFDKPETFEPYKWVFDFTASEAFFNKLTTAENIHSSQLCSASISDFGNLGILYKEGPGRNPRIDDLQAILHSEYKTNPKISEWLNREQRQRDSLIVPVGVGCNSETTILSDEKVSVHSAYIAGAIKAGMKKVDNNGKIILNRILEGDEYLIESESVNVTPLDVIIAENDPTWQIRFKDGILDRIRTESNAANDNETGGVFVGTANYKNKTIHVIDLLPAPPDSKADRSCFYRGYNGLSNLIRVITDGSGGQLGYVGEWHSHPKGPDGMSTTDFSTIRKFKREFAQLQTPLPVFLTIVAPNRVICYVY